MNFNNLKGTVPGTGRSGDEKKPASGKYGFNYNSLVSANLDENVKFYTNTVNQELELSILY